ncbi:MAG: YggS family pyridoxal phosphate-dependent enzyme [Erysipelotrichaceae bacterium]|nr:YggS family pyridoxal phosphate-dependent enzyme [Erysipelotrichaceae bacterium]
MKTELLKLRDITVVVTKNHSVEEIRKLYDMGFRVFGENRMQELKMKLDNDMPEIRWHFIGHLQTNKVRDAVRYCDMIQSVDSERLLLSINGEAEKQNKITDVLLQINIAEEETKYGFRYDEAEEIVRKYSYLSNVRIRGIMVIGPHTDDRKRITEVFRKGKELFDRLESNCHDMKYLSMGMSSDYEIALEEGSNMLRLGRIMFDDEF